MIRPVQVWNRFWFEPQATSTVAIVRIAFGLLVLVWTLTLIGDAGSFFSSDGIVPTQPGQTVFNHFEPGAWGLLDVFPGTVPLVILFIALIAGSLALTVGIGSRIAAVVVFLCILSLERRNPFVFNSGDYLIRNLSFMLMFAPLGASLSLDRWRNARDRFWEFPARAPWALRLIQIEVSVLYLSAVWEKVLGETWPAGTAVGYALRLVDLERLPVPDLLANSAILTNFITYGTLAAELSLGILIWNRVARPYVIALGIGEHLFIDYSLLVGFFSYAIFTCYTAFIPPDTGERWILRVRDRLEEARARRTSTGREKASGAVVQRASAPRRGG